MGIFDRKPRVSTEPPNTRPASIGEARQQIAEVFRKNRWEEIEQRANAEMLGMEYKPVENYSPAEVRKILDDFASRRMIIF